MNNIINIPVEFGRTYYKPKSAMERVKVTCSVCAGKRFVTVIDGYDKRWNLDCDACEIGFEAPRGYTEEYTYEPGIIDVVPVALASFHGEDFYVKDALGHQHDTKYLYEFAIDAFHASQAEMEKLKEENARRRATSKASMLKKKTWHVSYHGKCIKDLERQLAWHQSKLREAT